MRFETFKPPEMLKSIVWCFWLLEGDASPTHPFTNRPPASSLVNLIFHYQGGFHMVSPNGETQHPFITGIHAQTDKFSDISIQQNFGIFGVFLYPYSVRMLFGIDASEITNQLPDLFSLLGTEAKQLEDEVMLCRDVHERIDVVADFLSRRLTCSRSHNIIPAIQHIYEAKGIVNVDELATQTFYSLRQFERIFKEYCGFSAKKFSRIVRFNSVISDYKRKRVTLSRAAYDLGYYDQSHFIEEFREFSGINPRKFFSSQAFEIFRP